MKLEEGGRKRLSHFSLSPLLTLKPDLALTAKKGGRERRGAEHEGGGERERGVAAWAIASAISPAMDGWSERKGEAGGTNRDFFFRKRKKEKIFSRCETYKIG